MENNSPFDSFELQLSAAAQDFLKETGKWAMFLSIVGFIALAFMILGGLFFIAMGNAMDGMGSMGAAGVSGGTLGFVYIIAAVLYFFPVMYLNKFASRIKQAFNNNSTELLTEAFGNLKSHYKFMGILTIIMIAFYILAIIIGIIAGVSMAAGM